MDSGFSQPSKIKSCMDGRIGETMKFNGERKIKAGVLNYYWDSLNKMSGK